MLFVENPSLYRGLQWYQACLLGPSQAYFSSLRVAQSLKCFTDADCYPLPPSLSLPPLQLHLLFHLLVASHHLHGQFKFSSAQGVLEELGRLLWSQCSPFKLLRNLNVGPVSGKHARHSTRAPQPWPKLLIGGLCCPALIFLEGRPGFAPSFLINSANAIFLKWAILVRLREVTRVPSTSFNSLKRLCRISQ